MQGRQYNYGLSFLTRLLDDPSEGNILDFLVHDFVVQPLVIQLLAQHTDVCLCAYRKRELLLSVQLSPAAAAGHLLLPDPLWRFQGSAPCTHVRLQRTAKQGSGQKAARELVHLQSITLLPVAGHF